MINNSNHNNNTMNITEIVNITHQFTNDFRKNYEKIIKNSWERDYRHFKSKYIVGKSFSDFYNSLDKSNKEKFITDYAKLRNIDDNNLKLLREGINMITWLFCCVGSYRFHVLAEIDFDEDDDESVPSTDVFYYEDVLIELSQTIREKVYKEYQTYANRNTIKQNY